MSRPPEPARIPWRDIFAFPLRGISLRLFFLILGIILILLWQLALHADRHIAATRHEQHRHTARLLQHTLQTYHITHGTLHLAGFAPELPHAVRITAADGRILYQNRPAHGETLTLPIRDGQRTLAYLHLAAAQASAGLARIALPAGIPALLLMLLAWWLAKSLHRISRYAEAMAAGQHVPTPVFSDIYLKRLANAVATLRRELDGKTHIEHYLHHLTHELKTPLTAIHAAAEILHDPLSDDERRRFLAQIERHTAQMHSLITRLLELARLENRDTLRTAPVALHRLIRTLSAEQSDSHPIETELEKTVISGDALLIRQAVQNLLDNAFAFAPPASPIRITLKNRVLTIRNYGESIPAYALPRLYERFFSLPRPATGQKSSGLGLAFVQHIMTLHGGRVTLANTPDGVQARLEFPNNN